ncbi:MAG: sulfatase-like hydrolase/transferase [Planctomycetes bacterium]|nr:sulfatase-like hydrolase/transferase [Planctomycetota bacterium]
MQPQITPLALVLLALPAFAQDPAPQADAPPESRNILILVADDLGVDMVGAYGESQDAPRTPNIDRLAEGGVLFRNAWTAPMCSPSRASIQTGRQPKETGIGFVLADNAEGLADDEMTIPEMLKLHPSEVYASGLFGKWHLGGDLTGPVTQGYNTYKGYPNNLYPPQSYFDFTRYDNGVPVQVTTYATTDTVDQALAWIATAPEPWVCVVSFHAPHEPFHAPPANLHHVDLTGAHPRLNPRPLYKAAVEALDTELGRMMLGIGEDLNHTNVFFMGDNGTPKAASAAPFLPEHAKLTPYEGGINVPFIVRGPAVHEPGSECDALISLTDLYATVADLADVDLVAGQPQNRPVDSISLLPYLESPQLPSFRARAYAGAFNDDNAGNGNSFRWHMLRDDRYKFILIDDGGLHLEMYDLVQDPFETCNLLDGAMTPEEKRAFDDILRELRALVSG